MSPSPFRQLLALTPYGCGLISIFLIYLGVTEQPLPVEDTKIACAVGAIYCAIASALTLAYCRLSLFSFPGVFLGTSGYYMVGLLLAYPLYGEAAFSTWYLVDLEAIAQGIPLIMLAFSCFFLGSTLAVRRIRPDAEPIKTDPKPSGMSFVRGLGWAIYGGSLVVILGYTLAGSGLSHAVSGGYYLLAEKQYVDGGSALFWGSLVWFLPWGVMILSASARTRKDLLWLAASAIPANAILILVGDRGGLLVLDLILLTRASLLGLRMKWWHAAGVAALIVIAVPTLMVLRQTASKDWSLTVLKEAVTQTSSDTYRASSDPLSALLIEGGAAYRIMMGTVAVVPSVHGFHYGADYVKSLPAGIPFFSRLFPDTVPQNAEWLKEYVEHASSPAGLGYLQVAEAYLQFGTWGIAVLYALLGFGITYGWQYCRVKWISDRWLAFLLILMYATLLWIRNEFNVLIKPCVWGSLLLLVLPMVICRSTSSPRLRQPLHSVEDEECGTAPPSIVP